jgi:hypothetical protein
MVAPEWRHVLLKMVEIGSTSRILHRPYEKLTLSEDDCLLWAQNWSWSVSGFFHLRLKFLVWNSPGFPLRGNLTRLSPHPQVSSAYVWWSDSIAAVSFQRSVSVGRTMKFRVWLKIQTIKKSFVFELVSFVHHTFLQYTVLILRQMKFLTLICSLLQRISTLF